MQKLVVKEFLMESGENAFRDWLNKLDNSSKARIQVRIFRLEQGNLGDAKSVGKGIWELRFTIGPGYRVYFAKDGQKIILLLLGGDKATQRRDITRAQSYWRTYMENKNG